LELLRRSSLRQIDSIFVYEGTSAALAEGHDWCTPLEPIRKPRNRWLASRE
jgi:hypothetical protein